MNVVARQQFLSDKADGDFRFGHLNVREWVESIGKIKTKIKTKIN